MESNLQKLKFPDVEVTCEGRQCSLNFTGEQNDETILAISNSLAVEHPGFTFSYRRKVGEAEVRASVEVVNLTVENMADANDEPVPVPYFHD